MFTLLPLFDLVYSVPGATFTAPFSSLGQTPEGAQQIFCLRRITKILIEFDYQDSRLVFFQGKICASIGTLPPLSVLATSIGAEV
jgi:hypothetical protein